MHVLCNNSLDVFQSILNDRRLTFFCAKFLADEMLQGMPDVVVHFGQSELTGEVLGTHMFKRAGINTVRKQPQTDDMSERTPCKHSADA
eukprot:3567888-Pleurochrysis_carterae.AAC.1